MRIHLIRKETIESFVIQHARSRSIFNEWLVKIKYADWEIPSDIKSTFPSADLLGRGTSRVVFDVGGNKYRVIVKYAFGDRNVHLFVCWIGTHAEYNKLCDSMSQYHINNH